MEALVGFWDGIVVDNRAPATEPPGSVKVRVPDIHGSVIEVPDSDLPWAIPNFMFAGANCGLIGVPPLNAMVNVIFKHGDARWPMWIGGGHRTIPPEAPAEYTAAKQGDEPKGWMWRTPGGYSIVINELAQTVEIKTPAGQSVELNDVTGEAVVTGNTKAILTAALMEIGLGATEAAVLGTAFATLFNSHTHSYFPGPLAQAATTPPVTPMIAGTHLSAVTTLK